MIKTTIKLRKNKKIKIKRWRKQYRKTKKFCNHSIAMSKSSELPNWMNWMMWVRVYTCNKIRKKHKQTNRFIGLFDYLSLKRLTIFWCITAEICNLWKILIYIYTEGHNQGPLKTNNRDELVGLAPQIIFF